MRKLNICILILFLSISCQMKNEKKDKILLLISYFLYSKVGSTQINCFDYKNDTAICTTSITYSHNLKSIKVYKGGVFSFENQLSFEDINVGSCGTSEVYSINFKKNDLSLGSMVTYSINGKYCGVGLNFANNKTEKYEFLFNGDLNTFTELIVGDYKFIPVR